VHTVNFILQKCFGPIFAKLTFSRLLISLTKEKGGLERQVTRYIIINQTKFVNTNKSLYLRFYSQRLQMKSLSFFPILFFLTCFLFSFGFKHRFVLFRTLECRYTWQGFCNWRDDSFGNKIPQSDLILSITGYR
jgi:hypothetical protein